MGSFQLCDDIARVFVWVLHFGYVSTKIKLVIFWLKNKKRDSIDQQHTILCTQPLSVHAAHDNLTGRTAAPLRYIMCIVRVIKTDIPLSTVQNDMQVVSRKEFQSLLSYIQHRSAEVISAWKHLKLESILSQCWRLTGDVLCDYLQYLYWCEHLQGGKKKKQKWREPEQVEVDQKKKYLQRGLHLQPKMTTHF